MLLTAMKLRAQDLKDYIQSSTFQEGFYKAIKLVTNY